jgi:hypothetical protein
MLFGATAPRILYLFFAFLSMVFHKKVVQNIISKVVYHGRATFFDAIIFVRLKQKNNRITRLDGYKNTPLRRLFLLGYGSPTTRTRTAFAVLLQFVSHSGISPLAKIFARGDRERAPIALLAKCEPISKTHAFWVCFFSRQNYLIKKARHFSLA